MEMKIYHCGDPKENPVPGWLRRQQAAGPQPEKTLVEQFKENPDAFFPEFVRRGQPAEPKRPRR